MNNDTYLLEEAQEAGGMPLSQAQRRAKDNLADALSSIAHVHSFNLFAATTFPQADNLSLAGNLVVSNWPARLVSRYDNVEAFHQSDLVLTAKRTILPVRFEPLQFKKTLKEDASRGDRAGNIDDPDLGTGIALSLHDASHNQYLLLFNGIEQSYSEPENPQLVYKAMQAIDQYSAETVENNSSRQILTSRELECLQWSAAGKSSEEIAIILQISFHTVNSYLANAMRKLDSVSRMQAVARACRLRLI